MEVLDRARSWAHGNVDAFAREQRLITQPEQKIGSTLLPCREDNVVRGSWLNKVVGDNQSKKREESCWTEDPRSLTPSASLTFSTEGLRGHKSPPSSNVYVVTLRWLLIFTCYLILSEC